MGPKPGLHTQEKEPLVLTQRAFLQGLERTPGSAHSLMSGNTRGGAMCMCVWVCVCGCMVIIYTK